MFPWKNKKLTSELSTIMNHSPCDYNGLGKSINLKMNGKEEQEGKITLMKIFLLYWSLLVHTDYLNIFYI